MGIELKKSGDLGVITIENAGKFNAMNKTMFEALEEAFCECEKDAAISVVILMGKGAMFCAGFDVNEIYELSLSGDQDTAKTKVKHIRDVVEHLASFSKPTIAVIDGVCLGAGLELALACRFRLASDKAKFCFPEISLGLIPGLGGTQRLSQLIDIKIALEVMLAGRDRMLPAKEALKAGLVDELVSASDLIKTAKQYAAKIKGGTLGVKSKPKKADLAILDKLPEDLLNLTRGKSQKAVESILAAAKGSQDPDGMELESQLFLELVFSEEAQQGMRKFLKIPEPSSGKPKVETSKQSSDLEPSAFKTTPFVTFVPEEYKALRDAVRDFARRRILPMVPAMEEQKKIPIELFREMGKLGLFGASFPEKYGGTGMSRHAVHIIAEELARVHASSAVLWGVQTGLACSALNLWGNEAQKQKYLVPAIAGEKLGAFALTDPDAGSDVAGMKTSARKEGSFWVLNGCKQFITNGTIADFIVVFAQTDPLGGNQTLVALIVDGSSPGLTRRSAGNKLGLHASETATLYFDDVRVPEENLLGEVGQGFKVAMTTLNGSRLGLCALALGSAKEAFELASRYTALRQVEGEPLYMKQTIQQYLAQMSISLLAMEAMIYWVTCKIEAGFDIRREAAEVKAFCTDLACEVIDTALQIFGGAGYMEEIAVARIWRDARVYRIFEGTNEINRLLAAKEIIKNLIAGRSALDRE